MKQFKWLVSFIFLVQLSVHAQTPDTTLPVKDSVVAVPPPAVSVYTKILRDNRYVNSQASAEPQYSIPHHAENDERYFYMLVGIVLLFGLTKAGYPKYFSNLFRVFFNSSLRQSQLSDQLAQDQLPSLLFNTIFVLSGGLYLYFVVHFFNPGNISVNWKLIGACILLLMIVYAVKYLSLKFIGWITGYRQEADLYTFIIFLINKIMGICLLPVVVILAFSDRPLANAFVLISFLLVGLMLLIRFFRSFGLLQSRVKISRFHFLLYIFSMEILPLFIIYKGVALFLNKSW